MAVSDPITALEYNNIRGIISPIIGPTTTGYGRTLTSNTVTASSDRVTAQQQLDLFLDLQSGYVHQVGSVNTTIVPADFASATTIDFQDITDFNTIANSVASFNHTATDFPSANFTTDLLRTSGGASCSSVRSTAWGTGGTATINHQVTLNFGNNAAFLQFLKSGGEVRFDASLTGGTSGTANTKDWDWARILSAMGTIRFGRVGSNWRTESLSPGTGTGTLLSSIATGTPTTLIYSKQGGGVTGGASGTVPVTQIYDDNFYYIYAGTNAALASATSLIFNIQFVDGDTGTGGQSEGINDPVDEQVTGNVTSNVYTYTADSEFVIGGTTYTAIRWQYPGQARYAPIGTINSSL